jgi:multidrug efflux pump subunit AcrA (membrane-fusion protein)
MAATRSLILGATFAALSLSASAEVMTVEESVVMDYRPAVARIEAADSATARSRLQGVVSRLSIDEGDVVNAGELSLPS